MKLTTTYHQGQRPGRARLGACGHPPVHASAFSLANRAGNWRNPADAAFCPMATNPMSYVAITTFEQGLGSNKRPAQHLMERST